MKQTEFISNIYLDSNEAAQGKQLKPTLESLGCKVEVKNLPVDIMITGKEKVVVAERKAVVDFAQSIKFNRLWDQCSVLSEYAPNAYLILEGWMLMIRKVSRIAENSILGMLDTVMDKYNVKVVPTPNIYWTALWIKRKAKELGNPDVSKEYALRPSARKEFPDHIKALYMLEGVLGPTTAKAVLSHYGSIEKLCYGMYNKEEFFDVMSNIKLKSGRHISAKDTEKVYKVVHATYKQDSKHE